MIDKIPETSFQVFTYRSLLIISPGKFHVVNETVYSHDRHVTRFNLRIVYFAENVIGSDSAIVS